MTDLLQNKSKNYDLGQDMFFSKWPNWIRWILFLPASIIAPVLFIAIYSLFQTWFLDLGEDAFYFYLLRGISYGAGIVFVGSAVAPKHQKAVALILTCIIAMLVGIGLLTAYQYGSTFNSILETLIILGSAGYMTYYIFHENK